MKDLMAAVSGLFGKRYSARQKERFARYMENRARERGAPQAIPRRRPRDRAEAQDEPRH